MKDEDIPKQNGDIEQINDKNIMGFNTFKKILDKIPEKNRNYIVWGLFIVILVIWILDIVIVDPLPFIDEAAITYLLYILTKYLLDK